MAAGLMREGRSGPPDWCVGPVCQTDMSLQTAILGLSKGSVGRRSPSARPSPSCRGRQIKSARPGHVSLQVLRGRTGLLAPRPMRPFDKPRMASGRAQRMAWRGGLRLEAGWESAESGRAPFRAWILNRVQDRVYAIEQRVAYQSISPFQFLLDYL